MSVLVDILAKPNRAKATATFDALADFGATLAKGGNVSRDWVIGWIGDSARLTAELPYADSLTPVYLTNYANANWKTLTSVASAKVVVLRHNESGLRRSPKLTSTDTLFLMTDFLCAPGPVHRGRDGKPVPAYLLRLSDDQREQLYFWQTEYMAHDRIWFESGTLEHAAYRETADPNSRLSQCGRELASLIEQTTKRPTYYWLPRYYGWRDDNSKWRCPGCGRNWTQDVTKTGLGKFNFRCAECRLISSAALVFDDPKMARIGAWRTRPKKG